MDRVRSLAHLNRCALHGAEATTLPGEGEAPTWKSATAGSSFLSNAIRFSKITAKLTERFEAAFIASVLKLGITMMNWGT